MNNALIHPNWHPLFTHIPLGLLLAGVLIELFSFLWKRSTIRTAGRWMILLGALAALPALTTGLYAFYHLARHASSTSSYDWAEIVKATRWGQQQWFFMTMHIWLMTGAATLFALASIVWLASSDRLRSTLHWPILIALLIALAGAAVGSWFSGEAVYLLGVAVQPQPTGAPPATNPWSLPLSPPAPAQVHLLLIGLLLFAAVGAVGITIRRCSQEPTTWLAPPETSFPAHERSPVDAVSSPLPGPPLSSPTSATPHFHSCFWLLAMILAIFTAFSGLWTTESTNWRLPETREIFDKAFAGRSLTDDQKQMFIHVILAAVVFLFLLVLAILTRFAPRLKWITLVALLLLLAAVGVQLWIGIRLLYGIA